MPMWAADDVADEGYVVSTPRSPHDVELVLGSLWVALRVERVLVVIVVEMAGQRGRVRSV